MNPSVGQFTFLLILLPCLTHVALARVTSGALPSDSGMHLGASDSIVSEAVVGALGKVDMLGSSLQDIPGNPDSTSHVELAPVPPASHGGPSGGAHVRGPPRVQRLANDKSHSPKSPKTAAAPEDAGNCNAARPLVAEQPLVWLRTTLLEEMILLLIFSPIAVLMFPKSRHRAAAYIRNMKRRSVGLMRSSAPVGPVQHPQVCSPTGPKQLGAVGSDLKNANYAQIISSCARAGDVARAEEWLLRILETGVKPEVSSFNIVIDACTKAKRVASAERWLLAMLDADVHPDVISYTTVIDACAKTGDVARAERWLSKMIDAGVHADVVSYNAVVDACAKAGDVRRAEQWFAKMVDAGVEPNVISYTALIAASARRGDLPRAESLLCKMEDEGVKANVNSYSAVIDACAKTGNVSSAEHWLSRMVLSGVEPDVVCYNALINACAKAGDARRAEEWLSKMIEKDMEVNVISYNAVINACAKARDVDRAEKWLQEMINGGVEVNVICYNAVINACARVGDVLRAEKWLDELIRAGITADAISYNAVIDACAKAGDADRARAIFSRMVAAGVEPTVVTFTSLASPLSKRGEYDKVERIMDEMLAHGCALNSYFLNILLCAYGNATPRQAAKAEVAFRDAIAAGVEVNEFIVNSLRKCLGGSRSLLLVRQLGLSPPAPAASTNGAAPRRGRGTPPKSA